MATTLPQVFQLNTNITRVEYDRMVNENTRYNHDISDSLTVTIHHDHGYFVMTSPLTGTHSLGADVTDAARLNAHWSGFIAGNKREVAQQIRERTALSDAEKLQTLRFVTNAQYTMLREIATGKSWGSLDYYDALNFFRDIERACK